MEFKKSLILTRFLYRSSAWQQDEYLTQQKYMQNVVGSRKISYELIDFKISFKKSNFKPIVLKYFISYIGHLL